MSEAPQTIGSYSVVREIGRGGMGVVYLARDPNLQRDVAVKTLPPDFAENPERLARFEREARLLASLSHGNIAAVHGLESRDGARSLVMEFVPGETLSASLRAGPLGVESSLRVCAQIAAALEAAHDAGVVHRDIKPGNVIVRPDGVVKVLDFGLAREHGGGGSSSSIHATGLPTRTMDALTGRHVVIGTPGYMSPEQARGKPLDKRTDVFSFGCVLYECLTGRNAFTGETTTDVVAAVLEAEPDWSALPARTPTRIRELLRHCLEKDTARRLRDMGDARLEIERAIAGSEWSSTSLTGAPGLPAAPAVRWKRLAPWLVALVSVALAARAWMVRPRNGASEQREVVAATMLGAPNKLVTSVEISPDGRTLAYWAFEDSAGNEQLDDSARGWHLRTFDSYSSRLIPGTQRFTNGVFSPDGKWFMYGVQSLDGSQRATLYKVAVGSDAPPVALTDIDTRWVPEIQPAWLDDGTIAIGLRLPHTVVRILDQHGVVIRDVPLSATEGESDFGMIRAIPGDTRRVFLSLTRYDEGKYVFDACVLDLQTGDITTLITNAGLPALLPPDILLTTRADSILAAKIDPATYALKNLPLPVISGLRTRETWSHGHFSISRKGDLVHIPGGVVGASRKLVVIEPDGVIRPLIDSGRPLDGPIAVSHDGSRIAATLVQANGLLDMWIMDIDRPILRRVAVAPNADLAVPCWDVDNRTLYYVRRGLSTGDGIYAIDVDSADPPRLIYAVQEPQKAIVWTLHPSRTNDHLVVSIYEHDRYRVQLVSTRGERASTSESAQILVESNAYINGARFSPDGKVLAYASEESGRSEIYVRLIRADGSLGAVNVVSTRGGWAPFWGWDTTEDGASTLYFVTPPEQLVSVPIKPEPRLNVGAPIAHSVDLTMMFHVMRQMPGGRALGILRGDNERPTREINVLFNAADMLRARAAGARQ